MTTFSTGLAHFLADLSLESLPPEVVQKARVCLFNAFGMGLNGHATPYAPVARAAALALDREVPNGATLFLDGRRTTVGGACLANAALFHGRAQEDTCGAAHFGTVLIPMLTALIETRGYPLARLIPALVAGYEAGGVLEKALSGRTTPAGFRSTAIYGTIAASAAAAKLMELPRDHGGGARQFRILRRRRASIVRRRFGRMALPGGRGGAQWPGGGGTRARRLRFRAVRP
jgi:2-methylcitrate dehydratase PrpD